jgi:hypothetical protein
MKIIPRFVHAASDYLVGLILFLLPNLLDFGGTGPAVWVPRLVGVMILLQAVMTDYELGVVKIIPIGTHLMTDYFMAVALAISPWLFGFANRSRVATIALVVSGILIFGVTIMTQPRGRPRNLMA